MRPATMRTFLSDSSCLPASDHRAKKALITPPRSPLNAANAGDAASFEQIASTTLYGAPLDVALNWDGSLWCVDGAGAPHMYDAEADAWNPFGEGISGVAVLNDVLCVFRGGEYVEVELGTNTVVVQPQPITNLWPVLPDTVKMMTSGVALSEGSFYFISGGWCYPKGVTNKAPFRLTDLNSWPSTPVWQDGVIDAALQSNDQTIFLRGDEYITVDLPEGQVIAGPSPSSDILPKGLPPGGIDAGFKVPGSGEFIYFVGSTSYSVSSGGEPTANYLPDLFKGWPATWNPRLSQAPSGRLGNLWSLANTDSSGLGAVVSHDGSGWSVVGDARGTSVSCGADGCVIAVNPASPSLWVWNGSVFAPSGNVPEPLQQTSVGDSGHVWARGSAGVYSFDMGKQVFTQSPDMSGATHIAANYDGSVWHLTGQDASVSRAIAATQDSSQALYVASTGNATKVASTGFGSAFALVQSGSTTSVYGYDSPYLMRSDLVGFASNCLQIVPGLSNLYVCSTDLAVEAEDFSAVLSVDAHTGRQVSSSAVIKDNTYTTPTFDPVNELIYVGLTIGTVGKLLALDARDLSVIRWAIDTAGGIWSQPALSGTRLYFADGSYTAYCLDTTATLRAIAQNLPVQFLWQQSMMPDGGDCYPSAPVIAGGRLYTTVWIYGVYPGGNELENLCYLHQCDTKDGGNASHRLLHNTTADVNLWRTAPPVMVRAALPNATTGNVLVVNAGDQVVGVPVFDTGHADMTFNLPSGYIYGSFGYDDGTRIGTPLLPGGATPAQPTLWFGGSNGDLFGLSLLDCDGNSWAAVPNTPVDNNTGSNQSTIYATPVVFKDQQGGMTILYGVYNSQNTYGNLLVFDPVSGVQGSLQTGVTQPCCLTPAVTNGVIYAGGVYTNDGAATRGTAQVYGIRVDSLVQALNFFIIESAMMQDPDPLAPGGDPTNAQNPVPPSRARYQTQVTLVDTQKIPRPGQHIKIWADKPTTIFIPGQSAPCSIGPGDEQYASALTGIDGSLVITSGYCKADGSDLPNMYAPVLRLWAQFMDPWERIVITPDHEFHQRVSTAHANASDSDPDKVNLVTTYSYAGRKATPQPTTLFTAAEQSNGQPRNCADAVAQMRTGTGFGSGNANNSTSNLFLRLRLHHQGTRRARRMLRNDDVAASGTSKYIAYDDTTGAGYFPTNIPAVRHCTVVQPVGMVFTKAAHADPSTATLQLVDHTVAATAFNALPSASVNPPWASSFTAGAGANYDANVFTEFWDWLVHAVEQLIVDITDIIVTVADEVMVAIRMVVNGIEQVFKAIVHVIDDIASALGSFFAMLAKIIEDVIAALSVLFHFGEIMWTHRWLANQIDDRMQDIVNAIQGQIMPNTSQFFAGGAEQISAAFASARKSLQADGGQKLSDSPGSNQSVHTAFTVGPNAQTRTSHASSCAWGLQKMRSGLPRATPASPGATVSATDPLTTFLETFAQSLTNDPDLSAAFAQVQSDFSNLFHVASVSQFFSTLLVTLLDMVETLLLVALDIARSFVEGILALMADAVQVLTESVFGYAIEIPVLTWLYKTLFNEDLTLLNLVTLVAAIPVTIIFRVVEGQYPSQANLQTPQPNSATLAQVASATAREVLGCFTAVFQLVLGASNCISDGFGEDAPPLFGYLSLAAGCLIEALTFPLISNATPTAADWTVYGIGLAVTMGGFAGVVLDKEEPALGTTEMSFNTCIFGIVTFGASIAAYVTDGKNNGIANASFAEEVIESVVSVLNPLKLFGEEAAVVVGMADCLGGIVELFMTIVISIETNSGEVESALTA
ncbi:hypothetical protein BH10ACI4_BH10ACI4_31060 [soil metagenome]